MTTVHKGFTSPIDEYVVLKLRLSDYRPTARALPEGYEAQIRPRSGLAIKHGVTLPNSPGTIDADYRGEIRIIVANLGSEPFTIARGDRIAQMIVAPVTRAVWRLTDSLDETVRGEGGFGHTGNG